MAYTTIDGKLVKVKKSATGKKYLSQPPRPPEPRREPGLFPGRITYDEQPVLAADKGEFEGSCNITRCQRPNSATWFNHSTRKYYCRSCAHTLNFDSFNRKDALEMWGHLLCTEGEVIEGDYQEIHEHYRKLHEEKYGKEHA